MKNKVNYTIWEATKDVTWDVDWNSTFDKTHYATWDVTWKATIDTINNIDLYVLNEICYE